MKSTLWGMFFLLAFNASLFADHNPLSAESLTLLGRSHSSSQMLELDEADWRWLRNKGVLTLGTSKTGSAPFELALSKYDYEGMTADYAELLAEFLRTPIVVRRYRNRAEVIEALKMGEVDLMGALETTNLSDPQLIQSAAYFDDPPVLVAPRNSVRDLPEKLSGLRLAMLDQYMLPTDVTALYPDVLLQTYPTAFDAMTALAFGQADIYMGGGVSASYLIKRNHFRDLQFVGFVGEKSAPLGFVVHRENTQLLQMVNRVLNAISHQDKKLINQRWKAYAVSVHGRVSVQFDDTEQHWLDSHSRIKVAVMDGNPPLSFYDQNNKFRGISADLLEKISRRIALKFDVVTGTSNDELIDLVLEGKADLMATFPSEHKRFLFTRPYWTSPYVLSTRIGADAPGNLSELSDKRLSLVTGSPMVEYLSTHQPDIEVIQSNDVADSMSMLADGKVDVVLEPLVSTQYLINNYYRDRLRISGAIDSRPAQLVLGTSRGEPELHSILEKVLVSIPPDEIDEMSNRWFGNAVVENNYWESNRWVILQVFAVVVALLIVAFCWVAYLRSLMRKRTTAEQELNEQMAFMRVLIDSLPHPIYVRDRHALLMSCNTQYLLALEVRHDQVIGRGVVDGLGHKSQYALVLEQEYFEVMQTGEPRIGDRLIFVAQGREIMTYHWILPFRGNDGEVKGIIAGWIDISERDRLHGALQSGKLDAENANRAKTTFLATMSHEIRTPMNAIVGMLELAMKKADQGALDRFAIEVAFTAAQGLLGLIGDILDVVRIESGRLELTPQRTAFKPLVESIVRVFEGLAWQKNLSLIVEFDADADRDVHIDPLRFKQILSNLLSNAIKFTQEGKVVVSVQAEFSQSADQLKVRVHVRDTGVGISKEDQERLFLPFSQVGTLSEVRQVGSGLGLMISRTLCELMNGELSLHSMPGIGTQIDVLLMLQTLEPLAQVESQVEAGIPGKVLNVLVVDDYPANRLLLQQQLAYLGHHVSDEPDGAHGLRAWRSSHFDVVITDCNMPVMNGYELVRHIRAEEERIGASRCLVLGFTANAQVGEIERCLAAGMDDCLFKPISMQDLAARLSPVEPIFTRAERKERSLGAFEGVDLTSLEQLTYGDRASIVHLLKDLAKSNEEDLSRLVKLFSEGDISGMSDLTHRIKGGARIINALELIHCCEQVQADCNNSDHDRLTQSIDDLHRVMEALAQTLEKCVDEPF